MLNAYALSIYALSINHMLNAKPSSIKFVLIMLPQQVTSMFPNRQWLLFHLKANKKSKNNKRPSLPLIEWNGIFWLWIFMIAINE